MGFGAFVALLTLVLIVVAATRSGKNRSSAPTKRASVQSGSAPQPREAWLSNDLQRMIQALNSKGKLSDRHFLLMGVVKETYQLRADPQMADKCIEVAQMHLDEFPRIKPALMRELGGVLPRVSTFQHYAAVLAERGEFERAVHVCEAAIAFGLHDGTKGGYEGRIERIKKKAEGKSGERKKASNARFSPAMEPVASSMVALQRPDSFSEPHRQRTRPIQAAVFPLDDIPFVPLPRAPHRWEEREAQAAQDEEEAATELFEILGDPGWDLGTSAKLSLPERPDPAYRRHFCAQSGTFLVADRGKVASHQAAPASALSFGLSGEQVAERPLSWGFYRVQVNPMGRGLVGVSSDHVLHCYDEQLRNLVALPLDQTPELRTAKSRLGITDREVHTHIRSAALRPDGGAYLFSVVDEAFALDMQARPLWGVRMPQQEGWERVGTMTSRAGTSADVEDALTILALSYPFGTEDVRRQYRELAKRWHPDKNPGNEVQAAQEFRKVVAATELLSAFDMTDFAAPEERAIYRKDLGGTQEVSLGDTGLTLTIGMSLGGDERSAADWIYASSFSASGGAFVAGYSGKIVETNGSGQPVRLFDTGSVPRRIADTGDYLYFLTDTRLYVIQGTTLCRLVDVFHKGELVVGQTGFGLLGRKAFRWYTQEGAYVGGIRTKHPLRRIYPTSQGWCVETRQHRVELRGVPAWLEPA